MDRLQIFHTPLRRNVGAVREEEEEEEGADEVASLLADDWQGFGQDEHRRITAKDVTTANTVVIAAALSSPTTTS